MWLYVEVCQNYPGQFVPYLKHHQTHYLRLVTLSRPMESVCLGNMRPRQKKILKEGCSQKSQETTLLQVHVTQRQGAQGVVDIPRLGCKRARPEHRHKVRGLACFGMSAASRNGGGMLARISH
jgi:hypothetical protein